MYRILVADDEPIERAVACKTIQKYFREGLEVVLAENGREAIELFKKEKCQVIILDIEMPGINGLEAAKDIRAIDKNCAIIFLTAFDEFAYARQALTVQAMDYLLKPTEDEELVAVIEEALRLFEEKTADSGQFEKLDDDTGAFWESGEEKLGDIRIHAVREAILNYIRSHYTEDISLQDIAMSMKYSDAYFCKLFKQCFEKNFTAYLSEFRIEKAKRLLRDVRNNVKEISGQVGYQDSNYFARVFKRITGNTPSEYRTLALIGQSEDQESGEFR
ncbi:MULTISPECIES: response regulator transcription factor [Robinsoniella]|uniref:response regulator transcription factor n=1 Tax=Robinsoniella TaxID=588605 RepID=UPI000489B923|nr:MULTISPECIES: response regulator [Robinsoniella]